tara:strand:+ start:203 stop:358 length:156 start_codon:yes stop_codon:yes gene_type:complete
MKYKLDDDFVYWLDCCPYQWTLVIEEGDYITFSFKIPESVKQRKQLPWWAR